MALVHKTLPPTIKIDRPNLLLNIDETLFYLNTDPSCAAQITRRAGVKALGLVAATSTTLEEYNDPRRQTPRGEDRAVLAAAADGAALADQLASLVDEAASDADLAGSPGRASELGHGLGAHRAACRRRGGAATPGGLGDQAIR